MAQRCGSVTVSDDRMTPPALSLLESLLSLRPQSRRVSGLPGFFFPSAYGGAAVPRNVPR